MSKIRVKGKLLNTETRWESCECIGKGATIELSVSSEDMREAYHKAYSLFSEKDGKEKFLGDYVVKEILKLLTTNDVEYTTVEEGKEEKKTVEEDKELIQAGKDGERLAEECLRKAEEQLKKQLKKEEKNSCESCGFDSSNCAQIDTQDCKYWKSKENSPEVDWEGLKLYLCSDNVAHQLQALINLVDIVKSLHERVK